jgi:ABC-2 type transport system permease protein
MTNKILTIISHEYFKRVKSKGFIIGTFLGPITLIAFIGIVVLITLSIEDGSKKLAIKDETNFMGQQLVDLDKENYFITTKSEAELKLEIKNEKIDAYVILNKSTLDSGTATVFSKGGGGIGYISSLNDNINKIYRRYKLKEEGINEARLDIIQKGIDLNTKKINDKGKEEKDNAEGLAFLGYILGFAIYILTFLYGAFVSRGVIEEKVNRIMEVLASSVKPFELMMGKVIGIGLVGLTQVTFWALMVIMLFTFAAPIVATLDTTFNEKQIQKLEQLQKQNASNNMMMQKAMTPEAKSIVENIPNVSPWVFVGFVAYFLLGYFFYASLFAGIGSAVDTEQDAAQLQLPITMPIILTIVTMPHLMAQPDSSFSIFLSIFPFSAPIAMVTRIAATNVPMIQIIASILVMTLSVTGAVWVAAKIYRIGILMTGKKPKLKDLIKWVRS